jgi:signal transduction histidine kinase
MKLTSNKDTIHFSYADNGIGMDLSGFGGSFKHMGIAGIENRVLSLEGKVELYSGPQQGFQVDIYIPTTMQQKGDYYGNIIS